MTDQQTDPRPPAPAAPERAAAPAIGVRGMARWFWRQLTSMRTALLLLLLLAIAALPGSIWPQRGIDAARVADYLDRHTTVGPWLDRLGFFDVYSSPWFAAVYLLLVVSLLGCVIPRMRQQWADVRRPVPAAPRRLHRLPAHRTLEVDAGSEQVLRAAQDVLRRRRYRVLPQDGAISGEAGALREVGNLLFHVSLVVIAVSLAAGHLLGWRGDVIVPEGTSFSSTAARYDTLDPGPWVDVASLPPWSLTVDRLHVEFEDQVPPTSPQFGQPRSFDADVRVTDPDGTTARDRISVNHPLGKEGSAVFLLGNGYAPVITVRDRAGRVIYHQATPFLPQDNVYRSVGAVKVTGASPQQLGFFGFFIPSLAFDDERGPISTFPDLRRPALVLGLYKGNLFPGGRPQSVYTLDTRQMTQVRAADGQPLRLLVQPGQTVQLPDGLGSITLGEIPRWAGLSVRSDPGKVPALVASLLGLAGLVLSLLMRRRRMFVRVEPAGDGTYAGRTLVTVAGMARHDDPRLESAVEDVLRDLLEKVGSRR